MKKTIAAISMVSILSVGVTFAAATGTPGTPEVHTTARPVEMKPMGTSTGTSTKEHTPTATAAIAKHIVKKAEVRAKNDAKKAVQAAKKADKTKVATSTKAH